MLYLWQNEMCDIEYERKFMELISFCSNMRLGERVNASMFEDHLNPRIKGMVRDQRLKTFCDIVDTTLLEEEDMNKAQKHRET